MNQIGLFLSHMPLMEGWIEIIIGGKPGSTNPADHPNCAFAHMFNSLLVGAGITMKIEPLPPGVSEGGSYDPVTNTLTIYDPGAGYGINISDFIHELVHAAQDAAGVMTGSSSYNNIEYEARVIADFIELKLTGVTEASAVHIDDADKYVKELRHAINNNSHNQFSAVAGGFKSSYEKAYVDTGRYRPINPNATWRGLLNNLYQNGCL